MNENQKRIKELQFQIQKDGKKYNALCNYCKKVLTNTAIQRLQGHRNRCKKPTNVLQIGSIIEINDDAETTMNLDNSREISIMDISNTSNMDISLALTAETTQLTSPPTSSSTTPLLTASSSTEPLSTASSSTLSTCSEFGSSLFKHPKSKKTTGLKQFFDKTTKKEEDEITDAIARFFFGCNIPLNVVEAEPFIEMLKKLRPAYVKAIPSRKMLSTTLLDKEYERQMNIAKQMLSGESVMLIDGWKNTASNQKTVVTMLHNANGEKSFLEAWDLSGDSENAEKLAEIVDASIKLGLDRYNTKVYAVVSDNAANMVRMGKLVNIWHSNCSAHVANLLAKDLLDQATILNVTAVLKEFRHADLEQAILEQGGTKIKLPAETRWCSYRDSCVCLKKNLKFMRQIIIDSNKVKTNVKNLLFDDEFIDNVNQLITLLDPVSMLLNKVQSTNCTLAESANLWLSLDGKDDPEVQNKIDKRTNQALNTYAITAFYLNPYCDQSKLNSEQKDIATSFLFQNLDGQGLIELDLFLQRKEYFAVCADKDLNENAALFWRLCNLKYPKISSLASKLINIPASSAQLERVFSNWGYIHSNVRNRLTFERSKKLLNIYYNTKVNSSFISDE